MTTMRVFIPPPLPPTPAAARVDAEWRAFCLATLRTAPRRYARLVLASERNTEAFLASVWVGQRTQGARSDQDRAVSQYCALAMAKPDGDPWALAEQVTGGPMGEA